MSAISKRIAIPATKRVECFGFALRTSSSIGGNFSADFTANTWRDREII